LGYKIGQPSLENLFQKLVAERKAAAATLGIAGAQAV